eukprot:5673661-Pyramimonas_sp.AAC.1
MEYFKDRRVAVGPTKEESRQKLPLTGRRKTCSIRVVLYYDPDYVPVARVWVAHPDPEHCAQWLKKLPESTNPGIHPGRWFNMNQAQRRQAVEQYKAEKRSFFAIEDPGPCLGPLRDIGLDVDDPPTPPEPA